MPLSLDPRNAIPVLESVPNLQVSEILKRLTTSAPVLKFKKNTLILQVLEKDLWPSFSQKSRVSAQILGQLRVTSTQYHQVKSASKIPLHG